MTSIKATKKLLKNSKGLAMSILLKEENEENGNWAYISEMDKLTFKKFGVKVDFEDLPFTNIEVMFIPYWRIGHIKILSPMSE